MTPKRPGVVTFAAWLVIIMDALALVGLVSMMIEPNPDIPNPGQFISGSILGLVFGVSMSLSRGVGDLVAARDGEGRVWQWV